MSLINLKLGDFFTPVAPLAIRKGITAGYEIDSTVFVAVHSRKRLSKRDLEPAIISIVVFLNSGEDQAAIVADAKRQHGLISMIQD